MLYDPRKEGVILQPYLPITATLQGFHQKNIRFECNVIFPQIYDTATGHKILTLHDFNNTNNYSKNLASFNPTDDLVLNDGVLWDVKGKRVIHKFDKFNNFVSGVFHPSGLEIIINSEIVSLIKLSIANFTFSFYSSFKEVILLQNRVQI